MLLNSTDKIKISSYDGTDPSNAAHLARHTCPLTRNRPSNVGCFRPQKQIQKN